MKTARQLARRAARALTNAFAPYLVLDEYGLARGAWTLADAVDWLTYAAPRARVVNVYTRQVIADRAA